MKEKKKGEQRKKINTWFLVLITALIMLITTSGYMLLTMPESEPEPTPDPSPDPSPSPDTSTIDVLFSPNDIQYAIISLISGAESHILVMVNDFTLPEIADALIKRKQTKNTGGGNVEVQVLFENQHISNQSQYWRIKDLMPTRTDSNPAQMHNTVVIIDREIVITGSFGWTIESKDNNENIVIIFDKTIAQEYAEVFNQLWKAGKDP